MHHITLQDYNTNHTLSVQIFSHVVQLRFYFVVESDDPIIILNSS